METFLDAPTKLYPALGDSASCAYEATIGDRQLVHDKEYCLGRGVAGLRAKKVAASRVRPTWMLSSIGFRRMLPLNAEREGLE